MGIGKAPGAWKTAKTVLSANRSWLPQDEIRFQRSDFDVRRVGMGKALILAAVGLIVAILNRIVGDEIIAWLPWFTKRLLRLAIEHLPEDQRARFSEEWSSYIDDVPGGVGKLVNAVGCVWAAQQITCTMMYGVPVFQRILKRFVDFSAAAVLLVICAPTLLLIAALLKLHRGINESVLSRTPIIEANGKSWVKYQFSVATVQRYSVRHENISAFTQITRFGKFLVSSGLSELPMLLNVLRGDMDFQAAVTRRWTLLIVGPARPTASPCIPGVIMWSTGFWVRRLRRLSDGIRDWIKRPVKS